MLNPGRNMRSRLRCAIVVGALLFGGAAAAQSAQETVEYIQGKIGNLKGEYVTIDDLKFEDGIVKYIYRTKTDDGQGNYLVTFRSEKVDLRNVSEFSNRDLQKIQSDYDTSFDLYCDDSYGKCVEEVWCYSQQDCRDDPSSRKAVVLSINLSSLTEKDRIRVKKAFVHLKSLYPLLENKELFD